MPVAMYIFLLFAVSGITVAKKDLKTSETSGYGYNQGLTTYTQYPTGGYSSGFSQPYLGYSFGSQPYQQPFVGYNPNNYGYNSYVTNPIGASYIYGLSSPYSQSQTQLDRTINSGSFSGRYPVGYGLSYGGYGGPYGGASYGGYGSSYGFGGNRYTKPFWERP